MNNLVIKAKNKVEVQKLIKSTIVLEKDEMVDIIEIKKPINLLFITIKGQYEIKISKKIKEKNKKVEKKSIKKTEIKQETKKIENKKTKDNKNNKEEKENKKIKIEKIEKEVIKTIKSTEDDVLNKIRIVLKEFLGISNLKIQITSITKKKDRYVVNVEGKDVRYIIGEKGSALNSLEYILTSIPELKHIRVSIDSNDYKKKREESLKNYAIKKAEKVMKTGISIKLNPMNGRERKIIHEVLSVYHEIKTESYGEEPKRYLVIKLKK